MKKVLTLVFLMGISCLFLLAQNGNNVTVAGSWKGTFADSVGSGTLSITLVQGSNGDVLGNYKASSGSSGSVTGDIESGTLRFILTQKDPGCIGSYTGKLAVNGSNVSGTYWGDDCKGKHSNGVISLTRVSTETLSGNQSTNSPATSTTDYVACGALTVYVWGANGAGNVVEELKVGSPVVVEGLDGDRLKVKTQSGKVGYITKGFVCKKADYEASRSESPSGSTAANFMTIPRPGIPPGTLRAVAWRAEPQTSTSYYHQPGSSTTYCTGSGTWNDPVWNGSTTCRSTYTPAKDVPISWTSYTIYNLVETANGQAVLSCTMYWKYSQCLHLVPGYSYSFSQKGGKVVVMGNEGKKKVKFNVISGQP
jgi:hypothetical protein